MVLGQAVEGFDLHAPNGAAVPVNQLLASGNACGPASLLNSFQSGSERWQEIAQGIPGSSDKSRLIYVIRRYSVRESQHFIGKKRWTHTGGINLTDLTDVANEMKEGRWLPTLRNEVLLAKSREKHSSLLKRSHGRLKRSLGKGFPPIISLQRYVLKNGQWTVVKGHFVVVTGMSSRLGWGAESFSFEYIDPWGGKKRKGKISVENTPVTSLSLGSEQPTLIATVPGSGVGIEKVKKGEKTVVLLTSVLGAF